MEPTLGEPFAAAPDTHVIPTYWPVPNVGVIPMNAFVIRAAEPVLVDTGTAALTDEFVDALASIVRPADLRWIWLTHEDRDHTGSLLRLLELAPQAKVVTTFMAIGRMLPERPVPARPPAARQPGRGGQHRRPQPAGPAPSAVRQPRHCRVPRRPLRLAVQLRLLRRAPADRR